MSMDFMIMDYIGQFAKLVSFLRLTHLELELDSSDMMAAVIWGGVCVGRFFWEFLMAGNLGFE